MAQSSKTASASRNAKNLQRQVIDFVMQQKNNTYNACADLCQLLALFSGDLCTVLPLIFVMGDVRHIQQ